MAAKEIRSSRVAATGMLNGVNVLAGVARLTLGPRGRSVVLDRPDGSAVVTRDGTSVANAVELADRFENLGAHLVRLAGARTTEVAGDGSTTTMVLAHAMLREGHRLMSHGVNPIELKRGIDLAVSATVAELHRLSRPCESRHDIVRTASAAAGQDHGLGELIAKALATAGHKSIVTIEAGKATRDEIVVSEGMRFDRGYLAAGFVTDEAKQLCVLRNPYVLVHKARLSTPQELAPVLDRVAATRRPLLIIAEDIQDAALTLLVVNNARHALRCCAVQAPDFNDRRDDLIEDIATFTGGIVVAAEQGVTLANVALEDLGQASRIEISRSATTIIGGTGKPDRIRGHIAGIERRMEDASSDFDRLKLEARIAQLTGNVASIKVGAATTLELRERKSRCETALRAVRAALEEGTVTGGGVALIRARRSLDHLQSGSPDRDMGIAIAHKALEEPLRRIAANAGDDPSLVVSRVARGDGEFGYDAMTRTYGNLVERGVLDPAKVVRCALQNAASIAGLMLSTGAAITEAPNPHKPPDLGIGCADRIRPS